MIRTALILLTAAGATGGLAAQGDAAPAKVDFATEVWPILEARCVDCHREPHRDAAGRMRNPKGGLRLDGKEWILRGGDGEDAVVPGEPGQSGLYTRTVLDPDDPDVMPEEGDRLAADQTDLLRRWIAEGADFGGWTGAAGAAASPDATRVPSRIAALQQLASGLQPPARRSLETALGKFGKARPLDAEGRLLRVSFPARQPDVGDDAVDALAAIRAHVAELDLARAGITDRALRGVARMRHLTRLDLADTAVGDRGLAALTDLAHLESLVLVGTQVTDRGLATLAKIPTLRHVRLWKSKVTAAGVAELRAALPEADIGWQLELPPVDPAPTTGGRGRRR